jgi:hypothetical protein
MKRYVAALVVAVVVALPFQPTAAHEGHSHDRRREALVHKALTREQWGRTERVVRISIIAGRHIAENRQDWVGRQWRALKVLWSEESGWQWWARNPSGACNIPQALPCSKIRDPNSPISGIRWGVGYVDERYGTPVAAYAHFLAYGWY